MPLVSHLRVLGCVSEAISRVKDTQIVDVLDVTLLEIQSESELLPQEMKAVECLRLSFVDCRNCLISWQALKSSE